MFRVPACGLVLGVAALAAGCSGSHHAAPPSPPRAPAWLRGLARQEAQRLEDPHPRRVRYQLGRKRDVVLLYGRFSERVRPRPCNSAASCSVPIEATLRGELVRLVVSPPSRRVVALAFPPTHDGRNAVLVARHVLPVAGLFPLGPGTRRCRFGGGMMTHPFIGSCTTALAPAPTYSGQTRVLFLERWRLSSGRSFSGGWLVTLGPTGSVAGTRVVGDTPPQLWK